VGHVAGGDLVHQVGQVGARHPHPAPGRRHRHVLLRRAPRPRHRGGDDRGLAAVALERRGPPAVLAPDPVGGAGQQPLQRGLARRGLAQRGQHLGDVAQEDGVGPDDQHTLDVEALPVLVEQERRPVQAHCGLAGPRAALHHQAGVERRPDDLVLLGGDGGDDVAHLARPAPLQLGQQRVGNAAVVGRVDAVGVVEHLVEQVVEPAAGHHEAAAAGQAEGVDRGGPVEGDGHVGPPVDHHRVAVGVLHVSPPDVPGVAELLVEAAEAEAGHVGVERGQPVTQVGLGDEAVDGFGGHAFERGGGGRAVAHGVETGVRGVDVGLLVGEIGMGHERLPAPKGGRRR
jgi:hypothetical protein